jgi:hypothetical protein
MDVRKVEAAFAVEITGRMQSMTLKPEEYYRVGEKESA